MMYEFTKGGWWFRWSALDATSRKLAIASMASAFAGTTPVALEAAQAGYSLGKCTGSGRFDPCASLGFALDPRLAIFALVMVLVSAVTWAMLSRRQDEMFNRVQNWALGMGGAWTGGAIVLWTLAEAGGLVPRLPLWVPALVLIYAVSGFWFVAVRRWAS